MHPDGAPLAASLQGVVVQRLVRRLCAECALAQLESELPALQQRLLYGLPTAKVRRPVGCLACRTTGYRGRLAIAEVVPVTPALRDAITRRASPAELVHVAREAGIPTLWDSGMHHVLAGETSLAELLDTVPPPETGEEAPQEDIDALLSQLLGTPAMKPSSPAPVLAAPVAPVRVLIVDDDAASRRARAASLSEAGYQIYEAADGTSALEHAKRLKPDIVITEVALPGLDAVGLLRAFAAEKLKSAVVVLTAQPDEAMDGWLRDAGARAVLRRDGPATELLRRLRELARAAS
jgi:CheY-like chemotaxis protein